MSLFCCPKCREKLNLKANSYVCENGHSFDRARQGYVNLLLPNKRHSSAPGDSREMVMSRRRFLESGKYDIFSDKLNSITAGLLDNSQKVSIVDCGCGEGYYDGRLCEYLDKLKINYELSGLDISKEAVKAAAGKYKQISFAVASSFDLPVKENSADIALAIFSPMVENEFYRILKTGGYLIYAVPGVRHLMGLKEAVYDAPYENTQKDTEYNGFQFIERHCVNGKITVSGEATVDLFKMTPYYYKTELSAIDKIRLKDKIETEIQFDFLVYRKEEAEK